MNRRVNLIFNEYQINSPAFHCRLGSDLAIIVRLSAPIKQHWAETHALDLSQLLDSTAYKEQHRLAMIEWSEEERAKDYGIFCNKAADNAKGLGFHS